MQNSASKKGSIINGHSPKMKADFKKRASQIKFDQISELARSGHLEQALTQCQLLRREEKKSCFLLNSIGSIELSLGDLTAAIKSFQTAIRINPKLSETWFNLGNAFVKFSDLSSAEKAYLQAEKLNPELHQINNNLGNLFADKDQFDEAVQQFGRAAKKTNNLNEEYLCNLAWAQSTLGQFDESKKNLQKTIEICPTHGDANLLLSNMQKYVSSTDQHITLMQRAISSDELCAEDKVKIYFALGKALGDVGDTDDAFANYKNGNLIKDADLSAEYYRWVKQGKQLLNLYTRFSELPANRARESNDSPSPIFICGLPRSGTTLIEQIIASHSDVNGCGELQALSDAVLANTKLNGPDLSIERYRDVARHYLASDRLANVKKRYFTDKMPINYRYLFLILSSIPMAKVIWCRRDRIPLYWSIYKSFFATRGNPFAYNFKKIESELESQNSFMKLTKKHFADQIIEISYQDLVEHPKDRIGWMLSNLGLPNDEKCMNFHETQRPVKTRSFHQVRQKIYTGSDLAWRKYEKKLTELGVL